MNLIKSATPYPDWGTCAEEGWAGPLLFPELWDSWELDMTWEVLITSWRLEQLTLFVLHIRC